MPSQISAQLHEEQLSFNDTMPFLPENDTEVARQLLEHAHLSKKMGSMMLESLDLSQVRRALDVACGVGGWIFDMARRYPDIQFLGIDKGVYFIAEARKMARAKRIENATFLVQDMHHLEGKIPGNFDLIHLGFCAGDVSLQDFPPLLQSLRRLCRPQAIILWHETELPVTNGIACEHLGAMVLQALKVAGRKFTPGNSLGITSLMGHLLRDAGFRTTQDFAHAIDVSAGTPVSHSFFHQMQIFGHQVRPFLLATRVTTETEFEDLFSQAQKEMQSEMFCGLFFVRTLIGIKQSENDSKLTNQTYQSETSGYSAGE